MSQRDHYRCIEHRDRPSGPLSLAVVGLEFWQASERLPNELLDALPEPAERAHARV